MRSLEAKRRATINFQKRWKDDPAYRAYKAASCKRFRAAHPDYDAKISNRWAGLKSKCKFRGIELSLTFEQYTELVEHKLCTYCGASLEKSRGASLDRVDSAKGYILGNCVPCCYLCNVMKSDQTLEQFYAQIERILAYRTLK